MRLYLKKLPQCQSPEFPLLLTCKGSQVWWERASKNAAILAFRAALKVIREDSKGYACTPAGPGPRQPV